MAKSKTASPSDKARYTTYKTAGKYEKNRKRRIQRHIKRCGEADTVAASALGKIRYRRKKPLVRGHMPRGSFGAGVNILISTQPDEKGGPLLSSKEQRKLNEEIAWIRKRLNYDRLTLGNLSVSGEITQHRYVYEKENAESLKDLLKDSEKAKKKSK